MSFLARLGVILGLNSAEFTKGLDDAVKKTREFERNQKKALKDAEAASAQMATTFARAGTAAGLLAVGFAAIAKQADDIMDVAVAFDMTVDSLLATKAALQAAGGEAENVTSLMSKLASVQQDARDGSDQMREAFTKLGISGRDVDRLALDDLFRRVATELAKVEDTTKRTALAQDLLGKAAKGVNWSDFVTQYKEVANPELARAIEQNAQAWQNIESAAKGTMEIVQMLIAPLSVVLNGFFDIFKIWKEIKAGGDADIDWGAAMGGMPGQEGASTFHAGTGKAQSAGPIAKAAQSGGYGQLSEKEKAAAKKAAEDAARLEEKMLALITKQQERLHKFEGDMAAMATTQQQRIRNVYTEFNIVSDTLNLERERYRMTENQYASEKLRLDQRIRMAEIEQRASDAQYAALIEMQRASTDDAEYARQIYEQKIKDINTLKQLEIAAATQFNDLERRNFEESVERQYSWAEGWSAALRRYAEDAEKFFNVGAQAFQRVMGGMDQALYQFVQTGKVNFKDLIGSMVKDLLYLQLKAQMNSIFASLLQSAFSVSVGKMTPNGGGFANGGYGSIGRAAAGGDIAGPTLIGENGPELFIPRTPGTVIPNGSWQQMSGRGGTTINGPYIANLSAIDQRTFEDYIYNSSNAVWAAGKYAEKSLTVGRGRA